MRYNFFRIFLAIFIAISIQLYSFKSYAGGGCGAGWMCGNKVADDMRGGMPTIFSNKLADPAGVSRNWPRYPMSQITDFLRQVQQAVPRGSGIPGGGRGVITLPPVLAEPFKSIQIQKNEFGFIPFSLRYENDIVTPVVTGSEQVTNIAHFLNVVAAVEVGGINVHSHPLPRGRSGYLFSGEGGDLSVFLDTRQNVSILKTQFGSYMLAKPSSWVPPDALAQVEALETYDNGFNDASLAGEIAILKIWQPNSGAYRMMVASLATQERYLAIFAESMKVTLWTAETNTTQFFQIR